TRNTCDIAAIPVLNEMTHLPVILDPSHATGKRSLVPAVSRAGVAIGADGLILEVHPRPEKAVSDGAQSLTLERFRQVMTDLKPYIRLWRESRMPAAAAVAWFSAGSRGFVRPQPLRRRRPAGPMPFLLRSPTWGSGLRSRAA